MNNKILLAPYAARLRNGSINPKNLYRPEDLVSLLNRDGYEVTQVGVSSEAKVDGVRQFIANLPWKKLRDLVAECATFVSCDSMLPHFVHVECGQKPGVVVWAQSDPRIYAHPENINLLKGREYLRQFQFQDYETSTYRSEAFVSNEKIVDAVHKLAPIISPEIPVLMREPLRSLV